MRRSSACMMIAAGIVVLNGPGLATPAAGSSAEAGQQLWSVAVTAPSESNYDTLFRDVAVGPDGTVYSVGNVPSQGGDQAMITTAHGQAGDVRWVARVLASTGQRALGGAVSVDAAAHRVYVTGGRDGDYLTVAYDLDDGSEVWSARYDGYGSEDFAKYVVVDPATSTVYVTGYSNAAEGRYRFDVVTIAYSSEGAQLWVSRYFDTANRTSDVPTGLDLDADGNLYLTSQSAIGSKAFSETLSYTPDGELRWSRVSDGATSGLYNSDLVVDAARGRVYVTGVNQQKPSFEWERLTQAYTLAGRPLWTVSTATDNSVRGGSLVVDPVSGRLLLAAQFVPSGQPDRITTTAFDLDGVIVWSQVEETNYWGVDPEITVDRSTQVAYVTGNRRVGSATQTVTLAYSATGDLLWRARLAVRGSYPQGIAADPTNGQVYVVGGADDYPAPQRAIIVAYAGPLTGPGLTVARERAGRRGPVSPRCRPGCGGTGRGWGGTTRPGS